MSVSDDHDDDDDCFHNFKNKISTLSVGSQMVLPKRF